jgi:predicted Zn-dependent protease
MARRLRLLAAALGIAALAACAGALEPADEELIPPHEEAKIGAAAHPEIVAQFGGTYDDHKLIGYLSGLVQKLSASSGQPGEDYRLTVLDTPVVNAFASPGGYIYVTRGLLALANDEAEIAGVLAHELGHLQARHSAKRQVAAERTSFLGGILASLSDSSYLASSLRLGTAHRVAAYSRDQELEADRLGMALAAKTQYDPTGSVTFLTSLQRHFDHQAGETGADAHANSSSIFSSHPGTPERVRQAQSHAYSFGDAAAGYVRNTDLYLDLIDGLPYGDSLAHGALRGQLFVHPQLRFRFAIPKGFAIVNHKDAILGRGPDEAIFIFDGAELSQSVPLKSHLTENWGEGLDLRNVRSFKVNGMQAVSAETLHKGVGHELVVIRFSASKVYRFLFITRPVVTAKFEAQFRQTVTSFRKLSTAQARQLKPLRVKIVTVQRGQTVNRLARLMAVADDKSARFRILNGLGPEDTVSPGQRVKIVVK